MEPSLHLLRYHPLVIRLSFWNQDPDGVGIFRCSETGDVFMSDRVLPLPFFQHAGNIDYLFCPSCVRFHRANVEGGTEGEPLRTRVERDAPDRWTIYFPHPLAA